MRTRIGQGSMMEERELQQCTLGKLQRRKSTVTFWVHKVTVDFLRCNFPRVHFAPPLLSGRIRALRLLCSLRPVFVRACSALLRAHLLSTIHPPELPVTPCPPFSALVSSLPHRMNPSCPGQHSTVQQHTQCRTVYNAVQYARHNSESLSQPQQSATVQHHRPQGAVQLHVQLRPKVFILAARGEGAGWVAESRPKPLLLLGVTLARCVEG